MYVSESLVGCLSSARDAVRVGNVTGDTAYPPKTFQAFDGRRQCLCFDVGEHHFHARLRKGSTEREPNPACSTCNERLLSESSSMISLPPSSPHNKLAIGRSTQHHLTRTRVA